MPHSPPSTYTAHRRSGTAGWWPLASYALIVLGLLASATGLGYWAGRHSRPTPLEFVIPPATPPAPITAYIAGVVAQPGVYTLTPGARVIDLVVAAGGFLADADHAALNLAGKLNDGQRVIVPTVRPRPPPAVSTDSGGTGSQDSRGSSEADRSGARPTTPLTPLNLNLASEAELDSLPRIGPSTAAAIVEWRDANGGFTSVEDLLKVRGIGQATLEALRPYVTAP